MWYLIEGMVLGCTELSAKNSETSATIFLQIIAPGQRIIIILLL